MKAASATKSSWRRAITFISNPKVSIVVIVLSVLLIIVLRLKAWPYLSNSSYIWLLRPIGTPVVFLIGIGLYRFRKHYQTAYGVSEIFFAIIICWISFGRAQTTPEESTWIAIVAAAYLIVRGRTNYEEGKKKKAT